MQQKLRAISIAFNSLSRPHRIMLGVFTVVNLAVAVWRPYVYHPGSESQIVKRVELDVDADKPAPEDDFPKDEIDNFGPDENGIYDYVVSAGDTLSSVLNQYGIDISDINKLVRSDKDLHNLRIGQELSWTLNDEDQLQRLTWEISPHESRTYDRSGGGFKSSSVRQTGEWQNYELNGVVDDSFANGAKSAGLSSGEVSAVIKSMQWQMDFRKLHNGDRFAVLTSRKMLDGKSQQSQLLGVRVHSGGKDYYAIRAADGQFYDHNGSGLSRGFMRFPTFKQYRVSSNFNPRRTNPVTGRLAPHKGVDFAVAIGTPVLAIGDGEVMVSKRSGTAGNYVAIRHGSQYITRYMHLKTLLVKPGQKVNRGDRIALSGNTGRSTGPHLHFEIWINNQAVNPLTAKLPLMGGLSGKERRDYLAQVREVIPQLRIK